MPSLGGDNTGSRSAGAPESECTGRVIAVHDGCVVVEVDSPEGCASCAGKDACHVAGLGGKQVEVAASGFLVGERVRIVTYSASVVRASCVLYLLPALLVLVGSFAGYATAEAFFAIDGNLGAGIGVAVGLVLGLLFVHFYKTASADEGISLRLERID